MSSPSYSEVAEMAETAESQELFDKHRGQRRWLGKEHHKGKDRLYSQVKDRVLIQKTIESTEPLSNNAKKRIEKASNDDFGIDVYYSMHKKNRWQTANSDLLKAAPSDMKAEVVERNIMINLGFKNEEKSIFAVHSKINPNPEDSTDFEIRSSTSSGPGQYHSNFAPESRELSKKASRKNAPKRGEGESEDVELKPTVMYNICKAHQSKDVVGKHILVTKSLYKEKKHRSNKKITAAGELFDMENIEFSEDEFDAPDEDKISVTASKVDLSQYVVESRKNQQKQRRRESSTTTSCDFEIIAPEFDQLFNVQEHLNEVGYSFVEAANFHTFNLEEEAAFVAENSNIELKYLNEKQVLFDASKWSSKDSIPSGETSLLILVSHSKNNVLHYFINSTIASNPSKQGPEHLRSLIRTSKSLYEAVQRICLEFVSNRSIIESMKNQVKALKTKSLPEMLKDPAEWKQPTKLIAPPNDQIWTCSSNVMGFGVKQEWEHMCQTVKETHTCYPATSSSTSSSSSHVSDSDEGAKRQSRLVICSGCKTHQETHQVFQIADGSEKCRDCLRTIFCHEFEADRVPIDLQIVDVSNNNWNTFDFLPLIIPLPIVNLYTRKIFESIYRDLGATGSFDHCTQCKSTLYFEDNLTYSDRCCPCGFCWCSLCKSVPHWPMTCEQFASWDSKWTQKYALCKAQGDGDNILMTIVCECKQSILDAKMPTKSVTCPKCKEMIDMETKSVIYKIENFRWYQWYRKYVYSIHEDPRDLYKTSPKRFKPVYISYRPIADIPQIKKSVVEICCAARSLRLDESVHHFLKAKEHDLVKKKIVLPEIIQKTMGSIVYLVENVTAWMYISDNFDRSMRKSLDSLMAQRDELLIVLDSENKNDIEKCIEATEKEIKSNIKSVEIMKEKAMLENESGEE